LYQTCSSPTATLASAFDLASSTNIIIATTPRTEMVFSYPPDGYIDGRRLGGAIQNMDFHGARLPWPIPSTDWIEAQARNNVTLSFANMTEAEQTFMFPIQLTTPKFDRILEYDPDVSITLLFNPGDSLAPEGRGPASQDPILTTDIQAGVVVAIVLGALAAAGIAAFVFAKWVFPYMKQRNASKGKTQEIETEETTRPASKSTGGWTRSSKPSEL
jgi:hypothetical protein